MQPVNSAPGLVKKIPVVSYFIHLPSQTSENFKELHNNLGEDNYFSTQTQ
jgi:hypothetical protein